MEELLRAIMNMGEFDNPILDALFLRAAKHPEVRIELCAALLEAELYTLVPRGQSTRPADSVARPQGRNITLIEWKHDGKPHCFVYTSARMARKGLKYFSDGAPHPMLMIAMPGERLLRMMQASGLAMALNPGTQTFELTFNGKAMTAILDGTLSAGELPAEKRIEGRVRALRPEQYPMCLVQPVFDHLKTRPEALAAWVLLSVEAWERGQEHYVIALLTGTDDPDALTQSVGTVMAMVNTEDLKDMEFGVTILDYGNPQHAGVMRNFVPFYAAPGYPAPPDLMP